MVLAHDEFRLSEDEAAHSTYCKQGSREYAGERDSTSHVPELLHDHLTGLPDRTLLLQRLEQEISTSHATPHDEPCAALLTMGLDRLKELNDTFGRQAGDMLLQQVGTHLRQLIAQPAIVARLGGDEFGVFLPNTTKEDALTIMAGLHDTLAEPFIIDGLPVQATMSIGATLYPTHGSDALALLRRADIAMYAAKREREGYLFYNPSQDHYSPRRLLMMNALRHAITRHELHLHYQPKIDLRTRTIHSVEALVRWQHPEFGCVPPEQFIPLAEQTGLITQISLWVLETAIRQCREWMDIGLQLSIAVNLSMWDLHETSLADNISAILTHYGVPPYLLRIELTESTMMRDVERAMTILFRLSNLGVQVSIDDFGTGYSSLAYLKRLPINELKIDRSFVQHITDMKTDAAIVRSTVMMAHSLGLQVVAEGVEDEATTHLLSDIKCDMAQGYYISRPVSASALVKWLHKST